MILSIKKAPARWIGGKKLIKVIVMCGKYNDFDPKIDKKVDFFHYISIGS